MHLIMFDLDGTLVDSNTIDSECYLQALVDVFGFDLTKIDRNWSSYPHVTDAGILQTLCQTELGRHPSLNEIHDYQQRFLELLKLACSQQPLQAILGAREILEWLNTDPNFAIAIATGAWQQTADYKLQQAGLGDIKLPMACSDDAHARVEIMKCAYQRSLDFYQQSQFKAISYIGDGIWDGIASKHLAYNFVGIGSGARIAELLATGASGVVADYQNLAEIMSLICS